MNNQTRWQRFRSRYLWATPSDLCIIMATIQQLVDEVARQSEVNTSILTLVNKVEEQLKAALAGFNIPPAIQAQIDQTFSQLKANNDKIAQAVTDNTPASDSVPAEPVDSSETGSDPVTPPDSSGAPAPAPESAEGENPSAPATP